MPRLDRRRVNPTPANIIGAGLRHFRTRAGHSQTELAEMTQVRLKHLYPELSFVLDQTDISRMETGKRPVWDYELRCLAQALQISADSLLFFGVDTET
jgi:transcriptional regulator with XRE-family HTH domain